MDDNMISILTKIKSEKKRNIKRMMKLKKKLLILLVRIKYSDNPNKLQNASREVNKMEVFEENLHEFRNELLQAYERDFEMIGSLKIADQIRQTNIRFKNIDDYECYINSIDRDYESEDAIFNGYIYK